MSSETAHKCLKDSPGGGVPLWGKAIRRPERKWKSSRRVGLGKAIGFEAQSPKTFAKRFKLISVARHISSNRNEI